MLPALKPKLLAETQKRVGLKLSIRIDGEAVMAPYLQEPLSGGALMLSAPEREGLERIRAAARLPGRAGRAYESERLSGPAPSSSCALPRLARTSSETLRAESQAAAKLPPPG